MAVAQPDPVPPPATAGPAGPASPTSNAASSQSADTKAAASTQTAPAHAPAPSPQSSELLLFEDIPLVITATRSAQPLNLSPVPISILTAEDIHYSGLTNIADILRFVPGVDIVQIDRNRPAIGVHGMNEWGTERTLTLVDGRNFELPFNSAADWLSIPVFMDDIERIEVVRGPGGAAWGANAMNGVVNIITKDPDKTLGLFATTNVNQFGDTYSQFRWGAADGNWSWRISAGYQQHESSDDAINNDTFVSQDFNREVIADGKAVYKGSNGDKLSFGLSYAGSDRFGTLETPFSPNATERLDDVHTFARFDHPLDGGGSAYLQWSGAYSDRNQATSAHAIGYTSDLDGQISLPKLGRHAITFGGNFRYMRLELPFDVTPEAFFPDGGNLDEYWVGGFIQDRVDLADRLWLDGQVRLDYDSDAHVDWSGRLALLYAIDKQQRHILRLATAHSFRSLNAEQRDSIQEGFLTILPAGALGDEKVWSLEAGYDGHLLDPLTLRVNGYYERYSDLIGLRYLQLFPPIIIPANIAGATGYGVEVELNLKGKPGELSAWYAYNALAYDQPGFSARTYVQPLNSVGLTGRLFLPEDWVANLNYRYTSRVDFPDANGLAAVIPASHRLDLTLSTKFAHGRGELMLGVTDVLNQTEQAAQELGVGPTEIPGRTFFARVQLKF